MGKVKFKILEHTADIKFKVYGDSLNELFENATLALCNYISRGNKIKDSKKRKIEIEGRDKESLFYAFLDELIYLIDAEDFLSSKAKITIKDNFLEGELNGDKASNYKNLDQIKAATYSEMEITQKKTSWEAQFVLDV